MDLITTFPPNSINTREVKTSYSLFDLLFPLDNTSHISAIVIDAELNYEELTVGYIRYCSYLIGNLIKSRHPSCWSSTKQSRLLGILGSSKESYIMMSTSCFIAASHCLCFDDLSARAISQRIIIYKPDFLVCKDSTFDKAIESLSLVNLTIPVFNIEAELKKISFDGHDKLIAASTYVQDNELFTLFTSGSTGLPKAISHSPFSYIDYAKETSQIFFGLNKSSVIFTATDAGWINGHTYAFYGPNLCRSTSVICTALSELTDSQFLKSILSITKTTCFYASVTFFRTLRYRSRISTINFADLQLDRVGSCGESLAHNLGQWILKFFSPKFGAIVNTYFQTETGGIITAPRDQDGISADMSNVGKSLNVKINIACDVMSFSDLQNENIQPNELLICQPWPGLFSKVTSDRPTNYFTSQGFFRLHDVGYYDKEGFLFIGGRSDDVMNVAGHRISCSEVENCLMSFDGVDEVSVVEIPDNVLGSSSVVLYSSSSALDKDEIYRFISDNLSQYHVPSAVIRFNNLPKTKSGKIIRRILRQVLIEGFLDSTIDQSTFMNKSEFTKDAISFFQYWLCTQIKLPPLRSTTPEALCSKFLSDTSVEYFIIHFLISLVEICNPCIPSNCDIEKVSLAIMHSNNTFISLGINTGQITGLQEFQKSVKQELACLNIEELPSYIVFSLKIRDNLYVRVILEYSIDNELYTVYLNKLGCSEGVDMISITEKLYLLLDTSECDTIKSKLLPLSSIVENCSEAADRLTAGSHLNLERRCVRCKCSYSSISELRGDRGFLIPIVSSNTSSMYICDLCLRGW